VVVSIKPSGPEEQGKRFHTEGDRFAGINITLMDLISYAYGLHPKQIAGGAGWAESERFDIDAVLDDPTATAWPQQRIRFQKLLAERFALQYQWKKRTMSAYALTVAQAGPKLTKSRAAPAVPPSFQGRGLGKFIVSNATMPDFARFMQTWVLDRPVIDRTGLQDRWDFALNWTPDQSQFAWMRGYEPPSDEESNDPPLFAAIQEQIGLKLSAEKGPVDILVIEHVEKPSPN